MVKEFTFLITCLSVLAVVAVASAQNVTQNQRRCFSFTWLGPRYHNDSEFLEATCDDATNMAAGVPCFQPLVVSYDGTPPDVNYIWENHGQQASCVLADTDVCVTYSYFFNGMVENKTHMCTRIITETGQSITSGCYAVTEGNYRTEVCVCRSLPGGVPCNDARIPTLNILILFTIFATTLFVYAALDLNL